MSKIFSLDSSGEILIFRYAIDSIEKKTEVNTADRNDTEALNCYFTAKTFHKSRRLFYFFCIFAFVNKRLLNLIIIRYVNRTTLRAISRCP